MRVTKDPLRIILGGILLVLGILALLGFSMAPLGNIFTVAGVITGALLVFKTRYL